MTNQTTNIPPLKSSTNGFHSPLETRLVIETRGLEKTYLGKVNIPVLHDINIQIREQEFVAIIGQSGSGKSTLLNILGALDVPTGGTVLINGIDISTLDEDGLAILRSEEVGFIFQAHFLLNEFTCLENALMHHDSLRRSRRRANFAGFAIARKSWFRRPNQQTSRRNERRTKSTLRDCSFAGKFAENYSR